jgi:hypothetical protein
VYQLVSFHTTQAAERRAAAGEAMDEEALERDAQAALAGNMLKHKELRGVAWGIMILCFSAVVREGLESFVFLGECHVAHMLSLCSLDVCAGVHVCMVVTT